MDALVRRATFEDARTIAELAFELVKHHEALDPERFTRLASTEQAEHFYGKRAVADDAAIWLAEIDKRIVGFAYVQFEELNYNELLRKAAWLHDLYVVESARNAGAGSLLLDRCIESAKELGAGKLLLTVAARNGFARGFFERNGFSETMAEMTLYLAETQ